LRAARKTRPRCALEAHLAGLGRELGRLAGAALSRGWDALREAAALEPRELARRLGSLALRLAVYAATGALAFVLLTAELAAHWPGWLARWSLALALLVGVPLALARAPIVGGRRGIASAWNLLVVVGLLVAYGRGVGGTVRRHGDWFLAQRSDGTAAALRVLIGGTGALFEWFTPPPELITHELPIELAPRFFGPWRPGEDPYPPEPVRVRWFHPLADAPRSLPAFESRRFGAIRPQPRPWECELGHCGVDLAAPLGERVVAVADGIVERVERNADAGGRAGRYVRVGHCDGSVVTRYIHLDTIRKDLRPGRRLAAGELIGTVGRTGVVENFPHLHFGLSRRAPDGSERYVDPEPLLRLWELRPSGPGLALPPLFIARR
jgi:murein DD-endopeptidase MepM/ murein hydrolase activator NlpD